jgi:hypothetical protein
MRKEFVDLTARIDQLQHQMRLLFPRLAAARNAFMVDQTAENEEALERIQAEVSVLHNESSRLIADLPAASGLTPEMFDTSKPEQPDPRPRRDPMLWRRPSISMPSYLRRWNELKACYRLVG